MVIKNMSKAVLVIDMPESCRDCSCFSNHYSDMCCKGAGNRTINYPFPVDFRQDWCPLKPLPEKDNGDYVLQYSQGYQEGWNDCIRAIDKE